MLWLFLRGSLQFLANGRKTQTALGENLGGEAFFFTQEAEQQMLGADVLVAEALCLFGSVGEDPLALVGERKINGGGDLLANRGVLFDLLADGLDGCVGAKKTIGQSLVFTEKTKQEVFGFNVG